MSSTPTITFAMPTATAGICYRVLIWENDALPEDSLAALRTRRARLLTAMQEAGLKGARGKLSQLAAELKELNTRGIEAPLAAVPAGADFFARAQKVADVLRQEPQTQAFCISPGHVVMLLSPVGEEGVDAALARLVAATPDVSWYPAPLIEAISPAEAEHLAADYRAKAEQEEEERITDDNEAAPFKHITVLRDEAVAALRPAPGRILIDATLGGGGHSELMLEQGAEVWGIDQDPAARRAARRRLAAYGDRLHVISGNFRHAAQLLQEAGAPPADGLLADIGISSPQVDCVERGFSFSADGPLDMRMNPSAPKSAADLVNNASEEELADILHEYGEERAARAIARRIVQERKKAPLTTTKQLADLICTVLPRKGKQHPATRSFQALRIAVNDELGALEDLLHSAMSLLKSGGRLAVITFHSLEDRAVKRFFEQITRPEIDRPEWPEPRPNPDCVARLITRKPITPGDAELAANPRARSAKLRVAEKL